MTCFIPKEWLVAEAVVCSELSDAVSCFMHELCSHGVTIEEESGYILIKAYFDPGLADKVSGELNTYIGQLSKIFPECPMPELKFTKTLSENWAVAWKENFKVMEIGSKIMISPPWLEPDPGQRSLIIIEPAEAFGTGSHETTQGCLELLEGVLDDQKAAGLSTELLDVGCGSGILAIAAVKLGADSVAAIDNDHIAVQSALENAGLNGVKDRITFECCGIRNWQKKFAIITANLDAITLSSNIDALTASFADKLIVSGVTISQWMSIKELFESHSLKLVKEIAKKEWVSAVFSH